jgi:hypothetical protein
VTRRAFAAALTGAAAAVEGGHVVLEAVYGARLPRSLRVPRALASSARYFELRAYAGSADVQEIFAHAGLRPRALGPMRFLIPFDSLEQRSRSWDRLNSDPEWARVRAQLRLVETTIYCQPGGRIFEMSL